MKYIPILSLLALCFFLLSNDVSAQCVFGNCKDGTGIYMYPSGAKYTGQFKDGEIHGIGTCYYTDGSTYKGEWSHRYPEGNGIKTLADGRSWEGTWKMGLPIGTDGEVIETLFPDPEPIVQSGCLEGNCEDGKGMYAYPDGTKYEGEFKDSKPNGEGVLTYPNEDFYFGYFKDGLKDGKGTFHYADNTKTTGEWRSGEYIGNSLIEDGKVGCVEGDCKNGNGTYIYKDGAAKFIGTFANGMPDGEGTIFYANGESYKGEWALGSFNGEGTLYLPDGTQVIGYWKEGSYMGKEDPRLAEKPESPSLSPDEYIAVRKANEMKVWAVIVGISSYSHMQALKYTDDDAYRMYAFLKSPEGGALADNQISILIDEDATKEKILKSMKATVDKAGENDLVMIYFSGHGLRGSFLPIDFDGYQNKLEHEEINEILQSSKSKYKLVIADACHSGSLLAMKSGETRNVLEDYYRTLAMANAGTALIMSSKSDETSLESSGLRQGVFSHFLIRGLKGEADLDHNKIVSVQELFDFVDGNVRAYTMNRQSPVIKGDYDGKMTVSVVR
ncbi:MAG: caspase family protein [Saprospiraceae bacterium]